MKKVLFLVGVAIAVGNAHAAYRCVDEKGVTHVGDMPPPACANVPMFEISRTGAVLKRIDPTPTAAEVKARDAEAADRKEKDKAAGEQRRKDLALLGTYSSAAEFDMARDRNIEPVKGRIQSAQERIAAVDKRLQEISDEMEFYKAGKAKSKKKDAGEMPEDLKADYERVEGERTTLARSIAGYEKEIVEIRAKYDSDKKRWVELKNNPSLRPDATANANVPSTAVPLNWSRGSAKCGEKNLSCRKGESFLCLKGDGTWHTVACEPAKL